MKLKLMKRSARFSLCPALSFLENSLRKSDEVRKILAPKINPIKFLTNYEKKKERMKCTPDKFRNISDLYFKCFWNYSIFKHILDT